MPIQSRYLFIASMDVDPQRQSLFNEVYNTEHCPLLSQVPGVTGVSRFELQPLTMSMGGETRTIKIEGEPIHHALVRIGEPRGVDQPRLGGRRRTRPLAAAGAPPHRQPPSHSVEANLPGFVNHPPD